MSFQDEESRFVGCLGSRSLIGALTPEMEQHAEDSQGVKLSDALRESGLAKSARELAMHVCWIHEAHTNRVALEDAGRRIGVARESSACAALLIFRGQQITPARP